MEEVWKDIKGYEGIYQVSNLGNVKSLNYNHTKKERILKPVNNGHGYYFINLCLDGKVRMFKVHRLVANAFIDNTLNKKQVNHINGIKSDNRAKNLEWSNPSENIQHAFDTGLKKPLKGECNGKSKLTENDVLKIRYLFSTGKYTRIEISEMFNVTKVLIGCIINRKIWQHI